ncbi:TIGR00268 family protein [Candidatus Epulonipiscium fishelsonii]|uniref:TIGR00268 family protein n=1 Tax=Candidatus Epulonipiscium fishelsonii TaxID=77094 RepID=A0ACC8XE42_9FIRM|nr:TIGR00268 family protein [Epulopiscium sp. SCG-B05WGA-EpuloA1]ONI41033.1 TIGR00268 family protein [Epulopiscium sp. SCG-B11WGA-EpuloA1]
MNLKPLKKVCIAFSGGVDSTYLLYMAYQQLGRENVLAVTATSSMCPEREFKEALEFIKKNNIKHITVAADEYNIKEFVENGKDRCYYCKKAIFSKIKEIANQNGIEYVLDGSNKDDDGDYRPGMKALAELNILSPLKQAGLTKQQIRDFSKIENLPTWDKPAMACLASRIPYGKEITKEKLAKIEQAENFMADIGFKHVRVRYYDELAKIEVPAQNIEEVLKYKQEIVNRFGELGFKSVALDLKGYRMGSMNEVL